jgi:hypothetical protein
VRLERLGKLKNPMTSSVIEPTTFRPVAQCLNQINNNGKKLLLLTITIVVVVVVVVVVVGQSPPVHRLHNIAKTGP